MITAKLPYTFLAEMCRLTWHDMEFGLTHRYISTEAVSQFACSRLSAQLNPDPREVLIASSSKEDSLLDVVKCLAAQESVACSLDSRQRWVCLLLVWLYDNRNQIERPMDLIEQIYVDLDYPEELAHLVCYMPTSREAYSRLFVDRWGEFARRSRERLRP